MNLQLELYKFKQEFLKKIPPEKAAIIISSIQDLAGDFKNRRTLRIGDRAPNFILSNTRGEQISLSKELKKGPVLLNFFRGYWCPYCNLELRAYQKVLLKIQALGSSILAVSPQTFDTSQKTIHRNSLSFDLLSDIGCKIAQDYGIMFEVPDPLKQLYQELGHSLPDYNGIEDWFLPAPATFIIDRQGYIALAHINVDYHIRYEPADAIAVLFSLFVSS